MAKYMFRTGCLEEANVWIGVWQMPAMQSVVPQMFCSLCMRRVERLKDFVSCTEFLSTWCVVQALICVEIRIMV